MHIHCVLATVQFCSVIRRPATDCRSCNRQIYKAAEPVEVNIQTTVKSVRAAETYPVESSRKYKDFRYTKIGSGQTKLVDHLSLLCIFTPPFF